MYKILTRIIAERIFTHLEEQNLLQAEQKGCHLDHVHGTERKISHLLYMDDIKLLGRGEDDMKNEIKIVKAISIDINVYFGLENCTRICLKKGRVQSKIYI